MNIDKRVLRSRRVSYPKHHFSWAVGTHLSQPWFPSCVVVHIHQVRFGPERTQARLFQRGPPVMEEIKLAVVVPGMQLELQLPDRERRARERTRRLVRLQECGQRVKLGALNVDLQHVDESMS
jgi:hypothetical protein